MKKRVIKIVATVLVGLILLVALALAVFSISENIIFADFYSKSEKEFKIPGLWSGSVPQGFEYLKEDETFLYTGYHKDSKSPSMVYVMEENGEESRVVELFNEDKSAYTGHVGGITVYGDYAYIATKNGLDVFMLSDILDGDGEATLVEFIEVGFNVAFCEVEGDRLYVGNFYRAVDYETPESHHITTPAGDENTSVIYEYALNLATGKPETDAPIRVFSTTEQIQGMTFGEDGQIILSSSWGLSKSHILIYDLNEAQTDSEAFNVNGKKVSLTYLDSSCLVEDIEAPPMAEEIVYDDGKLYIMTEAASTKYIFGKITGAHWCYAYEI